MPCGLLIQMCVYDKLSYDSVPTQLSLSSSPRLWRHLLPYLSKCTTAFISACLHCSVKEFIMLNSTLTQHDLAQINSRRKATLELSLYKKKSTLITFIQDSTTPVLKAAAACHRTSFDVVWCIDRSAARSWMTSSRDHKKWATTPINVMQTLWSHLWAKINTRNGANFENI